MSQTLALIVAAMVLMMTALTLIFMTQDSLEGLFSSSEEQSCISTAETKCSIASGESITIQACEGADVSNSDISGGTVDTLNGEVTCN
jgi:hypothetical protein